MKSIKLIIQDSKIDNYLKKSEIIDFENGLLKGYAAEIVDGIESKTEQIKEIFEFVRDHISHIFDIGADTVTFRASEVMKEGHGVCYAKSHLLVALLRSIGIPAGFCYQGLVFDDVEDKRIVLHGLVGVYVEETDKWIRLDARGNKPGVDAQFSLTEEKLAFPVRKELGEWDSCIVYSEPNKRVIDYFLNSKNKAELIKNLPESI